MKKITNMTIAICISLTILIIYNISSFSYQCDEIRNNIIRLHILANSDSTEDQYVKLKVRDAILEKGYDIFDGSVNIDNATECITPVLDEIKETADKILRINKMNYSADVSLVYEYFDTRTYDNNVTLPAGKYIALKIVLGEGKGQNWWCVMFPSLCLPAAEKRDINMYVDVFNNNQTDIISNKNKYEIRFKIIELIELIKSKGDIASFR